jgi:hypothetical protein
MCDLYEKSPHGSVKGWKIVAEDLDGKNYSLAMGFCYDDFEKIPIIKNQKRLTSVFNDRILQDFGCGFRVDMIGRTAIFKIKSHAVNIAEACQDVSFPYRVKVKPAQVSCQVLMGEYSSVAMGEYSSYPVAAGKKIKFLD